jgi:hypothetical protein
MVVVMIKPFLNRGLKKKTGRLWLPESLSGQSDRKTKGPESSDLIRVVRTKKRLGGKPTKRHNYKNNNLRLIIDKYLRFSLLKTVKLCQNDTSYIYVDFL